MNLNFFLLCSDNSSWIHINKLDKFKERNSYLQIVLGKFSEFEQKIKKNIYYFLAILYRFAPSLLEKIKIKLE